MVESRASSCLTHTLVLSDTLAPPIYNIGAISFLILHASQEILCFRKHQAGMECYLLSLLRH